MWTLLRTLLVALALTGFIGQATAHASPADPMSPTAAAAMDMSDCCPDCPEMAAAPGAPSKSKSPCPDMGPACLAKTGCVAAVVPLPAPAALKAPIRTHGLVAARPADTDRDGAGPPPLQGPPKPQA